MTNSVIQNKCVETEPFQLKEGRANGHLAGAIGALTSVIFMSPRQVSILGTVSTSSSGTRAGLTTTDSSAKLKNPVKTSANGVALLIALVLLLGTTWVWGRQLPEAEQPVLTTAKNRRPTPPTQIKIGGVIYAVELVREVPGAGDGFGFYGRTCDTTAQQRGSCDVNNHIYLEAGRPLIQEQTTLLHEIQHAILGIDKSAKQTTCHHFIYELSPKLLELLQDNPGLYRYLTATESQ